MGFFPLIGKKEDRIISFFISDFLYVRWMNLLACNISHLELMSHYSAVKYY